MWDESTSSEIAYICECGRKWTFGRKMVSAQASTTVRCDCGRIIVVGNGVAYSRPKAAEAKSRR